MYQFVREGKKMGDILYGFCLSVFIVYLIFGAIIFEKYQNDKGFDVKEDLGYEKYIKDIKEQSKKTGGKML